jgi:AhpD family alkylhydroperoxidase
MRNTVMVIGAVVLFATAAYGQDIPFIAKTFPKGAQKAATEEFKIINGDGALSAKVKQLIGLAVAAQIPCQYCIIGHKMEAKKLGATDAEIQEALAASALTRKWSTMLNGSEYDMEEFKKEMTADAPAKPAN